MRFRRLRGIAIAWLLIYLVFDAADAAESYQLGLETGDRLSGECAGISGSVLSWRTRYGDTIHVPIRIVTRLTCEGLWDLQCGDGQILKAHWEIAEGRVTVSSAVFGVLHCAVSELYSAVPSVSGRGLESALPASTHAKGGATESPASDSTSSGAPPSSLQTLLRLSSILLRPGQWSLTVGGDYVHNHAYASGTDTRQLGITNLVQRGITPRVEASLAFPVTSTRSTTTVPTGQFPGFEKIRTQQTRAGDPEFSVTTMLSGEGRLSPECVAVIGLTVPTHNASDGSFFRPRLGLEFLKTSDPAALFGGVGWVRDLNGWQSSPYRPVDHFSYHLGAAIGLNDELALGIQVQGEYRSELKTRQGNLASFSVEPVAGKFWFNLRTTQRTFLETSVTVPLNDDTHTTSFGVSYIRRY